MVRIRVLRGFRDLKRHMPRIAGETFEDTLERAEQIAAVLPGYIEFSEEEPMPATDREPELAVDLTKATVAQLRALCDERGIECPSRARKADLLALLEE